MKVKLQRRILRNLKRAQEEINNMVENLEDESMETGFAYVLQSTKAAQGDLQIVLDMLKDDLREDATKGGAS